MLKVVDQKYAWSQKNDSQSSHSLICSPNRTVCVTSQSRSKDVLLIAFRNVLIFHLKTMRIKSSFASQKAKESDLFGDDLFGDGGPSPQVAKKKKQPSKASKVGVDVCSSHVRCLTPGEFVTLIYSVAHHQRQRPKSMDASVSVGRIFLGRGRKW